MKRLPPAGAGHRRFAASAPGRSCALIARERPRSRGRCRIGQRHRPARVELPPKRRDGDGAGTIAGPVAIAALHSSPRYRLAPPSRHTWCIAAWLVHPQDGDCQITTVLTFCLSHRRFQPRLHVKKQWRHGDSQQLRSAKACESLRACIASLRHCTEVPPDFQWTSAESRSLTPCRPIPQPDDSVTVGAGGAVKELDAVPPFARYSVSDRRLLA